MKVATHVNYEGNPEPFDMMRQITSQLSVQVAKGQDGLLVDVLSKHLGRLIVTDDFKDCEIRHFAGLPDSYVFAYKGIDLGIVKKILKFGASSLEDFRNNVYNIQYDISFYPIKSQPQSAPL